jgi:hypothetical protein
MKRNGSFEPELLAFLRERGFAEHGRHLDNGMVVLNASNRTEWITVFLSSADELSEQ